MKSLDECQLYTFVDSAYLAGRDPIEIARQLCDGGADLIQLRAKDWPMEQIEAVTAELAPLTRDAGVWLVVNDYLAIADKYQAPLCHLGQEDFFDRGHTHVSELLRPGSPVRIGMSTHDPDQAKRSVSAGAAYVAIGPVYATATKPGREPVRLDYVRWAKANVDHLPWFAIGGIHLGNLDDVLAAGAQRICVVSAILNAANVAKACEAFKNRLA